MPGTPFSFPKPICEACRREVDYVRGSMFHGDTRICLECFYEWYDGHCSDPTDPVSIGNYVRKQHGLPPLTRPVTSTEWPEPIPFPSVEDAKAYVEDSFTSTKCDHPRKSGGGSVGADGWSSYWICQDCGASDSQGSAPAVTLRDELIIALRRISSLEEKNVPKYAQQIARAALRRVGDWNREVRA